MSRKIKLYINGMLYGDLYSKFMLWSILLLCVASIGSLVIFIAIHEWFFILATVIFAGIAAFLISGLDFGVGVKTDEDEMDPDELDAAIDELIDNDDIDHGIVDLKALGDDEIDDLKEKKDTPKKPKTTKKKKAKSSKSKNAKSSDKVKNKSDKNKENAEGDKDLEELGLEDEPSGRKSSFFKTSFANDEDDEDEDEEELEKPFPTSKFELNQIFKQYKVKKNHRPILIDSSEKYGIKESPAFVWKTRKQLHILVLGPDTEKIDIDLNQANKITYAKHVPANQKKEYECLIGQDLIPLVFGNYRPIYQSINIDGRSSEAKNLYMLHPDIFLTAPSAREIMLMISPEFIVMDEVTRNEEYNQYYKQVYKQKIMLDDGVLNIRDYQMRVRMILQKMAEAPITPAAFKMSLGDMQMRGLITPEYATYFTQYHRQYREKKGLKDN